MATTQPEPRDDTRASSASHGQDAEAHAGSARPRGSNDEGGSPPPAATGHAAALGANARIIAVVGVVAACAATLVLPGLRGTATESTVATWERIVTTLTYGTTLLAISFIFRGAYELARPQDSSVVLRFAVGAAAVVSFALCAPALTRGPVPAPLKVAGAAAATLTGVAAGVAAARAMHTRAAGLTVMLLATGAALRLVAYMTLQRGAEAGDTSQYGVGLALSTASLVFEALAYLVAALWLATRGGMSGKVLVNVALGIAICVAWLAGQSHGAQGADARSVLQVALTTSGSHGLPNRLSWLGRFLAVLSPMLAGAFVAQWRHASLVVAGIGLAILSRGALDVPLYAFLLLSGSLALVLAAPDKRSMWTQLIAAKK